MCPIGLVDFRTGKTRAAAICNSRKLFTGIISARVIYHGNGIRNEIMNCLAIGGWRPSMLFFRIDCHVGKFASSCMCSEELLDDLFFFDVSLKFDIVLNSVHFVSFVVLKMESRNNIDGKNYYSLFTFMFHLLLTWMPRWIKFNYLLL